MSNQPTSLAEWFRRAGARDAAGGRESVDAQLVVAGIPYADDYQRGYEGKESLEQVLDRAFGDATPEEILRQLREESAPKPL